MVVNFIKKIKHDIDIEKLIKYLIKDGWNDTECQNGVIIFRKLEYIIILTRENSVNSVRESGDRVRVAIEILSNLHHKGIEEIIKEVDKVDDNVIDKNQLLLDLWV